jgi:hypothetical protein
VTTLPYCVSGCLVEPMSARRIDLNARCRQLVVALGFAALPALASAQVTPAAGYTPPDDTPSIKVGATIFTDYTYTDAPTATDADGNIIHSNAFNVARSYINVTGNISHVVAFRITPDVTRETGTGSSLNGSLTFRLKYAFVQVNLDDWFKYSTGNWVRVGQQQTPYIDFMEGIYRYRFQGTTFVEREGFQSSADSGVSFHTNLPSNYGDVHVGIYNGETYTKSEANNIKAVEIRGTIRPFAKGDPVLRGLRLTGFYDKDAYVKNGERNRFIGSVTFEHKYVNAGFDYFNAEDQPLVNAAAATAKVDASGESFWITPKTTIGIEGLFRFDTTKLNDNIDQRRKRTIAGIAYWFPHQGNVSTAALLDFEQVKVSGSTPPAIPPTQQRIAVHMLVNF